MQKRSVWKIKFWLLILMILLGYILFSCMPEPLKVDNVPRKEKELVVSSYLIPDSVFLVYLSRTFDALAAGPNTDPMELANEILIDKGYAELRYEGKSYPLVQLYPGLYGSYDIPQVEKGEYELYAYDSLLQKEAYSNTTLKQKVVFDQVKLQVTEQYDTIVTVQYEITDPPGPNWYMINVQQQTQNYEEYNFVHTWYHTELIEDLDHNGKTLRGTFPSINRSFSYEDTIAVTLSNISREYYEYLKLRNNMAYWFLDATQEPVNFPTNVENGRGYFTAHFIDAHTFYLKEYE